MATAMISNKEQVTIPKGIQDHHTTGDEKKFLKGLEKTLSEEWMEKNDEEVYKDLKDT